MVVEAKVRLLAARLRCPLCLGELEAPGAVASRCPACATAYHAACVAELGVPCATLGCRLGPTTPPRRSPRWPQQGLADRPRFGLVVPLLLTWLLYVPWPLGLVSWGWALWRAGAPAPGRRAAWATALLLSPFVAVPAWSACAALFGYATGTAELTQSVELLGWDGRPHDRTWDLPSLDPEVRCPARARELAIAPELGEETNALVLRGLAMLFGPMAHAYTGPLPTAAEASVLLDRGQPATVGTLAGEPGGGTDHGLRLTFDRTTLDVTCPVELSRWAAASTSDPRSGRARAAWLADRQGALVAFEPDGELALLVDVPHRRVVAGVRAPRRLAPR